MAEELPESGGQLEALTFKTALAALEKEEREVVLLSFIGGYSSGAIGQMLSMKGGSVRSKKSRAVAKLREMTR